MANKHYPYGPLIIFPFHPCNYHCDYCTVYTEINTELKWRDFGLLTGKAWNVSLNEIYGYEWIIMSGGEPPLHPEFHIICDGLETRKINVYSNISIRSMEKLLLLEKPIHVHASYHSQEETKKNGEDAFQKWCERLSAVQAHGHFVLVPHTPNDGSDGLDELPEWLLRTRLEGMKTLDGKFYSPYVEEERCRASKLRKVMCSTHQLCVASDGTIWNCQAKMWSRRGEPLGHIESYDWDEIGPWIECSEYGQCHPCSQGKSVRFLDGK